MLDRCVASNETLALEHVEHTHPQARRRGRHLGLLAHLRVVDARDHVAERIVHCHLALLLTSSTSPAPESALWNRAREAQCATACACGRTRVADRTPRSDYGCASTR